MMARHASLTALDTWAANLVWNQVQAGLHKAAQSTACSDCHGPSQALSAQQSSPCYC